jgi:hypothetical protein
VLWLLDIARAAGDTALESPLPRFRDAIADTIATFNSGRTSQGIQLPSKFQMRDPALHARVDAVVEVLVQLRATFDAPLHRGTIKRCRGAQPG